MEETFNIKAIILNRKPFSEDGSKVTVYSENLGKLELVARGTKKIKSKMAGHLEPIGLVEIMVVRGKRYNYIGAAVSEDCYAKIKNDFAKIKAAGEAIKVFNLIVKTGESDPDIFYLLKSYFDFLNNAGVKADYDLLAQLFIFKLLIKLGHKPELYNCVNCRKKIPPLGNKFDLAKGGLACAKCLPELGRAHQLAISENSIKILRLADKSDFKELEKISLDGNIKKEVINIISLFFKYSF
ncbi:MAG: DNA repair protein RecO [Patescibacteria group bacterium]|jgi:DNA repair protein RecO (recombination protein O)